MWNFDYFVAAKLFKTATGALGLSGLTMYQARHSSASIERVRKIQQDVSAGKCVAGMMSPPRQHASRSPKVISACVAIANLLHRARMPWILEHPRDSRLWDVPKIQALAVQPRTAWVPGGFLRFGINRQKTDGVSGWKRE